MGEPLKQYQKTHGTETAIQLNDKFATTNDIFDYMAQEKSSMAESDAPLYDDDLKIDKDARWVS